MNGYETDEMEALADALEGLESDESDEWMERRRGGGARFPRFPSPQRPQQGGLSQPRPQNQYVTQTQLQAALTRVEGRIKTNTEGIAKVNARVNIVSDEQGKLVAAVKKETAERKKENAAIQSKLQMSALLPLLTAPKNIGTTTAAATIGGVTVPAGTKLLKDEGDSLSLLLPMLLLGGGGLGTGSGSSGSEGGMDSTLLVLALALRK